jgi:hypothetical protein
LDHVCVPAPYWPLSTSELSPPRGSYEADIFPAGAWFDVGVEDGVEFVMPPDQPPSSTPSPRRVLNVTRTASIFAWAVVTSSWVIWRTMIG